MTEQDRATLRALAVRLLDAPGPQSRAVRWNLQTSNSFRRVGTLYGDGDVLCATNHPRDGHPDLLAAPGVLDYIVAAQPSTLVELLDELRSCEVALELSRRHRAEDRAELERLRGELERLRGERTP